MTPIEIAVGFLVSVAGAWFYDNVLSKKKKEAVKKKDKTDRDT